MLKIGLTGGIGSGKTTVANLFAERNIPVIDTDVISHQLSNTSEVISELAEVFGTGIIKHDRLDRAALANEVFNNDNARTKLEAIMHPRIRQQVVDQYAQTQHSPYVIVVVPLLLETDYHELVDRILIVDSKEDQQISRVRQRDGRDKEAVQAIMSSQLSRQQRLERADDIIDNSGDIDRLDLRINDLDQLYRELSERI